jgi:hypothetical protein
MRKLFFAACTLFKSQNNEKFLLTYLKTLTNSKDCSGNFFLTGLLLLPLFSFLQRTVYNYIHGWLSEPILESQTAIGNSEEVF